MAKTEREYKSWIKQIVCKPIRSYWGDAWKKALTPEMRSAIVDAACFSVVRQWADSRADDGKVGVTSDAIEKLLTAVRAEFDGELE